jgi:ADP-heptose:LPS heptosyltransferase
LPLAFSTELGTIPAAGKYLSADPGKVAKWRAALAERDKPRVGLAWRGDPNSLDDRNRSIALQDLLRQLPPDFQYFSLQKEVTETERRIFQESLKSVSIADELDFTDTAALCECLDLVISVDTSVAHLSGSLGARTWILLPFSPDCRWLLNRADSPWYPTVTLYRQERSGDWSGVLARVGADLTRELAPPS